MTLTSVPAVLYTLNSGGTLRVSKDDTRHMWRPDYLYPNPDLNDVRYVNSIPEWLAFVREACDITSGRSEE